MVIIFFALDQWENDKRVSRHCQQLMKVCLDVYLFSCQMRNIRTLIIKINKSKKLFYSWQLLNSLGILYIICPFDIEIV
jgi:hypothetical protein